MNILSLRSTDLCRIVAKEVKSSTPLAFCSPPNHDPSYRVEKLAVEMGSRLTTVAMGSPEALISAEKAITNAAKTGTWVLLKNVHLSLHWLGALEKKMYTLRENHAFRLFLTMENNDGIPTSLLRMSRIIMSEPSPGLCEGLMDLLHVSPAAVSTKTIPAEKTRMHFLLAFLHSQLVERLRYRPLGWSKHYDFSEADFACASSAIEQWVGTAAAGKSNIAPAKIPWTSIRSLFCDAIYGGRVDNAYDQRILDAFVRMLFTEKAFESGFHLIDGDHGLLPDSAQMTAFMQWTKSLVSETQQPSWLRLSDDVDDVVLAAKGMHMNVATSIVR